MRWPAESIYAGTWASGDAPIEMQWVELMLAYSWSWEQLTATPAYVRRVCWDLLVARREAEQSANGR